METIVVVIFVVFVVIGGVGMFRGIDLKKWSDWPYALGPLLGGLLIGLLINNLLTGLMLEAIGAALILYSGAMTHWQRQYYEKKAGPWLLRNEGKPYLCFLARMIRKRRINKP